jgi:tetratricopeptide (TPR) repeat protein
VPKALAKASRENKALFVDAWAPWCHTCLSMKHYVFDDPALAPLAERVVFAAIDTDRDENAKFLERYKVDVWPTFFVIEPGSGKVLGYWPGAASLGEMRGFVEDSLDALDSMRQATLAPGSALASLIEAKAAQAAGDPKRAAKLYEQALATSPTDWPRRSVALFGWLQSLFYARDGKQCVAVGLRHIEEIRGAARPADFASYLFECTKGVRDAQKRGEARKAAITRLRALTANPPADSSFDDRADAFDILSRILHETGDRAGARKAQEDRLGVMERAAKEAPSPQAAATFDYGRANAYLSLGRADEAIAMLEQREKEMPDSYEPPARLASLLARMKRWPAALDAINRALKHAYGPRKLSYLRLKADIQTALGDRAGRISTIEEEIKGYQELGGGKANEAGLADAKKRLAAAQKAGGVAPR